MRLESRRLRPVSRQARGVAFVTLPYPSPLWSLWAPLGGLRRLGTTQAVWLFLSRTLSSLMGFLLFFVFRLFETWSCSAVQAVCLWTHCIVHTGLKLLAILLPQPPQHRRPGLWISAEYLSCTGAWLLCLLPAAPGRPRVRVTRPSQYPQRGLFPCGRGLQGPRLPLTRTLCTWGRLPPLGCTLDIC